METKKYTQFGTFSVAVFLILLLPLLGKLILSGIDDTPEDIIFSGVCIVLVIGLLFFYKLTILVTDSHVSFRLGIGLFGRSYRISDIRSVRPVKNSILSGIGIRMLSNGWLYNVSGLEAIELHFKNKNSVVRIGTDKAGEISEVINSLIGPGTHKEADGSGDRKKVNPVLIFILITLIIPAALIISESRAAQVNITASEISIGGIYGETILFSDLTGVDTLMTLPAIKSRTNGYAFGKTRSGNFRLTNGSKVKLFIKKGYPPYVLLISKRHKPVYINFEDRRKTTELYNKINASRRQ